MHTHGPRTLPSSRPFASSTAGAHDHRQPPPRYLQSQQQSLSQYAGGRTPKRQMPSREPEEILIAVMGATGAGKSTFINLLSDSDLAVGEGLKSCTTRVETANTFELYGKLITLVDTPGFDDTTVSDTDILKMIAVYLSSTYETGRKLSGIIYMHRISDFRVGGVSRRNFSMFRKLCGDETLRNVALVTNMWSEVTPQRGAAREAELRTDPLLFAPVINGGATLLRHDGTLAGAQAVLAHVARNTPRTLAIQRELVDEHKDIADTAAGVELDRELAALRAAHVAQLAEIQREMEAALAEKDEQTRAELGAVRGELLANIAQIEGDRDRLSREFAVEKARADERVAKIQEDLELEKAARAERQLEISRLTDEMANSRTLSAREREDMQRQLVDLRKQRSRGGFFGKIGRAIDSFFGF
ncbi:P-loop containing nucleoside triphosphate hydrolase protein [Phanerochaete sordida]|uniref:P-loop containing nucleoside triphosphate hydrolase protein n=1 Tax=Phanerochaete sordida TaxID=48140 RepID=A0A9P3G662_9APHY|nr:P-loop containing nucleoside triphosphate hydrolase protein [Phanerochaete sordida]